MKIFQNLFISAIIAYTAVCPAQIVSNGDFEIPQVAVGIGVYSPTNASWVWNETGGIISPPGFVPAADASFLAPAPPSGTQIGFVQLNTDFSTNSSMSQIITLPATGTYSIRYYDAGRPYWTTGVGGNTTYQVLLDTNVIAEVSTTTGQAFTSEEFAFVSTAGSHTLTFEVVAVPTYDNTAFFDDINIELVQQLPFLGISMNTGRPTIEIDGIIGATNQLEYTTDLSTTNGWIILTNVVLQSTSAMVLDASATNSQCRFYRVVVP